FRRAPTESGRDPPVAHHRSARLRCRRRAARARRNASPVARRAADSDRGMKCPICKKEVAPGDPDFPFCSERCRVIDLGNWASGKYAIPVELQRGEGEEEEEE